MENSALPSPYYRLAIKGLVTDERGRFMLVKEDNGKWELPGGGLEHGESFREGLTREIDEEMGLEVTAMAEQPRFFLTCLARDGRWIANAVYPIRLAHLNFTPSSECVALEFFTLEEAQKMPVHENVTVLLEMMRAEPQKA
ncbi:MAG: NUDIX hydrolase [Bacteroidota bacterium]